MSIERNPHLPRYAVTGQASDVLDHEIVRAMRSPAVAARLDPLEHAAVLEYQRSRIAEGLTWRPDESPEMTPELRASLDERGSVAAACARRGRSA